MTCRSGRMQTAKERTPRRGWAHLRTLVGLAALLPSCAGPGGGAPGKRGDPPPVQIRFHLAATQAREGYDERRDELGGPLYVVPQPFLTDERIWNAAVFEGQRRHLVRLTLDAAGTAILERVTRANRGARLAVYIDEELAMSPGIDQSITGGQVYLDAGFSRARADEIARAIEAQRAARAPVLGVPAAHEPGTFEPTQREQRP
jgi:hypothetical protein